MFKNFAKILTASAILAGSAMALPGGFLIGVGGHWAPNTSGKMAGSTESIQSLGPFGDVDYVRGGIKAPGGFGFKAWLETPLNLDVHAGVNFQWDTYEAYFNYTNGSSSERFDLAYDPGFPFAPDVEPVFGLMMMDLSATYAPFGDILIFRPYLGGGLSYIYNTKPLSSDVLADAFESASSVPQDDAAKELVSKAYGDLESGVGFHVMGGIRGKLPVIPIAAYLNVKYHMGGVSKDIEHGMTLEVGGGFSI